MGLFNKLLSEGIGIIGNKQEIDKSTNPNTSKQSAKTDHNTEDIIPQNSQQDDFSEDFDPVEYSWEFLIEITELVFTKFSEQQQEEVLRVGMELLHSGAMYQHVIYNAHRGSTSRKN